MTFLLAILPSGCSNPNVGSSSQTRFQHRDCCSLDRVTPSTFASGVRYDCSTRCDDMRMPDTKTFAWLASKFGGTGLGCREGLLRTLEFTRTKILLENLAPHQPTMYAEVTWISKFLYLQNPLDSHACYHRNLPSASTRCYWRFSEEIAYLLW